MSIQATIFKLSSNIKEVLCLKNNREDEVMPLIVRAFCLAEILYAEDKSMLEEVRLMLRDRVTNSGESYAALPMYQALQIIDTKDVRRKHPAIRSASEEICSYIAIIDDDFASCMSALNCVSDKIPLLNIAIYAIDSFIRHKAFEKMFELYPDFQYSSLLGVIYENEDSADNKYLLVKKAKLKSFIDCVALSCDCELAQVNALVKCQNQDVFEKLLMDKSYNVHPRMIAARYLKNIEMRTTLFLEGGKLREDGTLHEDERVLWELVQGAQKQETFITVLNDNNFWLNGRIEAAKRVSDLNYIQERLKSETNSKLLEILAERLK